MNLMDYQSWIERCQQYYERLRGRRGYDHCRIVIGESLGSDEIDEGVSELSRVFPNELRNFMKVCGGGFSIEYGIELHEGAPDLFLGEDYLQAFF